MTKSVQKRAKKKVIRGKIKGRFEIPHSRQPLRYKALWELEDKLVNDFTTSSITGECISYYNTTFSNLYSTSYLWNDYSYYLYHVYSYRSVKCYTGLNNPSKFIIKWVNYIENLTSKLYSYYLEDLGINPRNISRDLLRRTCLWFIYHLNRINKYGYEGLKFSYSKNFYTNSQTSIDKSDRVSGLVVKNLINYLIKHEGCQLYKGYSFKLDNGDYKACMSLLLVPQECKLKYTDIINKNHNTKESIDYVISTPLVEVRVKGNKKEIVQPDKYEESWMDNIVYAECVMEGLNKLILESRVTIGKYEIPEIFFKRIWIGDVNNYGRIHDDGSFQTKPANKRKEIIIDGEETVTVDLSSLHPRILYTQEGIELPDDFDPYPKLNIKLDNRRINKFKKFYNIESYNPIRNLAKVTMLILINSNSVVQAKKAIQNKLKADGGKLNTCKEHTMGFIGLPEDLDINYVIEEILKHNEPIKEYLAKGVANKLMNLDSEIMIRAIEYLTSKGIVCLPLHDSVTLRKSFQEDGVKSLEKGWVEVMGSKMNFKYKIE